MRDFPAPGKLNLFLHVLGRRADGYHELQTVFRLIERADRIRVARRDDGELRFTGVFGADNLCLRAARLLKQQTSSRLGADIELEKRLPVGGGLGGGSSDAATVLLALNRLWKLRLSRDELQQLGARLGADVPLFIFGRNALGEGIGERLTALELEPAWYLVLTPQVAVSTKEIFAHALTGESKRSRSGRDGAISRGGSAARVAESSMPAGAHDGFRSVRLRRVRY
jgi:4-diphosphocytidyl-2-C-methyl-D-erythritol kinase